MNYLRLRYLDSRDGNLVRGYVGSGFEVVVGWSFRAWESRYLLRAISLRGCKYVEIRGFVRSGRFFFFYGERVVLRMFSITVGRVGIDRFGFVFVDKGV